MGRGGVPCNCAPTYQVQIESGNAIEDDDDDIFQVNLS